MICYASLYLYEQTKYSKWLENWDLKSVSKGHKSNMFHENAIESFNKDVHKNIINPKNANGITLETGNMIWLHW